VRCAAGVLCPVGDGAVSDKHNVSMT
jgi:hypothetical protein